MITKKCVKCGEIKSLDLFYANKHSKDKKAYRCKVCVNLVTVARYKKQHPTFVRYIGDLKICRLCLKPQPITNYNKHQYTKDGFRNECRDCQKKHSSEHYITLDREDQKKKRRSWYENHPTVAHNSHLKRNFNISHDEYLSLLEEQNGKCAICGSDKPKGRYNHFAVDHDHVTGKLRGLLCSPCNIGIGHLQDSPDLLHKAALYLETHNNLTSI
jgi:hypothetical protein